MNFDAQKVIATFSAQSVEAYVFYKRYTRNLKQRAVSGQLD